MIKKVLFAASEVYPFAKTGGLADVAYSLPRALAYKTDVIMPLYSSVNREKYSMIPDGKPFEIMMGTKKYPIEIFVCTIGEMNYRFIYSPLLCDREFLYGTPEAGYEDNAIRFGIFSYAIVALLKRENYDVVHLNDWQCGLVSLLVHDDPAITAKTLYTIHNLAYQGTFDPSLMRELGIDERHFTMEGIEFYEQISFMKAGIAYSDALTTVSPTYAKEILTPVFGCGLEGFLFRHRHKLQGIINGIDADHFSPVSDTALVSPYRDAKGKKASKGDLLKTLGLKGTAKPLFVFIGRFVAQKGMELLIETLPKIASLECNVAILGEGEEGYHQSLAALCETYSNVHLTFGYDEPLSHKMYAAGDFLLMPSLFEPCGLNQMIAFAYGAVPVVHRIGGLADTVQKCESFESESTDGFGIVFNTPTARSLLGAVRKACELYANKKHYEVIVNHNMKCDFSWSQSAKAYGALYERITR
ncbi:MAG TPA: glycogen/starch synthase [Sulfuricurvum sp.]|nr:glycogen/starch synthase [Sulfuricurvum sp.]